MPEHLPWVLAVLFLSLGCATESLPVMKTPPIDEDFEGRCALTATLSRIPRASMPDRERRGFSSGRVPLQLSPQSLFIGETIDVLDLIQVIFDLEDRREEEPTTHLRLVEARQQLLYHVQSALLEVESTKAEVRCEKERADQLADRLQSRLDRNVQYLTVSAIIGGAVLGFASGGLFLAGAGTAGTAMSITGGVVETLLGILALQQHGYQRLQHKRNILGEVWVGPSQTDIVPEHVWIFLNRSLQEDLQKRSLRVTLIARWYQDGRLGTPGSETERYRRALFFGDGGLYDIDELRDRAAMLNLLEADVSLMTQDLNALMEEVFKEQKSSPLNLKPLPGTAE